MATEAAETAQRDAGAPGIGGDDVWWDRARRFAVAHPALTVGAVALALRVAVAIASFVVNGDYLVPDEQQYVDLADHVARGAGAEAWWPGYGQALYDSTWVFSAPLALLFDLLGTSRLVGQLFVAVFGAGTAVLAWALARRLLTPSFALLAGLLVAAVPSQVLWSSIVLREALIWACLAGIALVLASTGASPRRIAAGAVALIGLLLWLGHLRNQTMVVAAWAVLLAAWLLPGGRRFVRAAAFSGVAVLVPLLLGLGPLGWDLLATSAPTLARTRTYLGLGARSGTTPTSVLFDRPEAAGCPVPGNVPARGPRVPAPGTPTTTPGAMAIAGAESRTVEVDGREIEIVCTNDGRVLQVDGGVGADLRHLPRGVTVALLRPYPWEGGASALADGSAAESVGWYVLYGFAVLGVVAGRRRLDVIAFPVLACGGLVLSSALTQGNLGTAFRQRAQLLWALAVLAAAGAAWLLEVRAARASAG